MTDTQVRKKLRLLARYRVTPEVTKSIKSRVYRDIATSSTPPRSKLAELLTWLFVPFRLIALTVVLVVFLGIYRESNPLYRAENAVNRSTVLLSQASSPEELVRAAKDLDQTQLRILALNLVGEPGRYTRDQCHAVYTKYEKYLQDYQSRIDAALQKDAGSQELRQISATLSAYKSAAESRWPLP